jgi:hypothetical protein
VAGGVVGALVLAGAGVLAYRAFAGGSAAAPYQPIADITAEPSSLWEWTPDASADEADYVGVTGGAQAADGAAVVVGTYFDYGTWFADGGYDDGWYQGYDEQYDAGYQAGVAYEQAVAEYYDNWYAAWPDANDYLPNGLTEDDLYLDENRGYSDGFYDGQNGAQDSRLTAPPEVGFTPSVVALSATDGSVLWTHPVGDDAAVDVSTNPVATVFEVPGGDLVGYFVNSYDPDTSTQTASVVLLSADDGTTVGKVGYDDYVSSVVAVDDDVFVGRGDDDGPVVTALSTGDLAGDPVWEKDTDQTSLCLFAPGVLATGEYVSATADAKGEPGCVVQGAADFFATADGGRGLHLRTGEGVTYVPVDAGYLMQDVDYDYGSDSTSVDGTAMLVDSDGKELWQEPLRIDDDSSVWAVDGEVFYGDFSQDDPDWRRVDPKSGEEAWDDAITDGSPLAVHDGFVVTQGDRRLTWHDLKSGEEKFDVRKDSDEYWVSVAAGEKYLYLSSTEQLRAFSPADEGDVWSYDIDSSVWLHQIGDRIYSFNRSVGPLG